MDVNEKKKISIVGDAHMSPPKTLVIDAPSNSHKSRMKAASLEERAEVEKVITGKVSQKKKGLGKKIKEALIGDAATDVSSYILYEVLIPGAKTILYEMIMGGLEMRMWGEPKTMRNRLGNKIGKPIVNYGLYSVGKTINNTIREADPVNRRPAKDVGEIIFDNKPDAVEVLTRMREYIAEYGSCSVNVLYSLIDKSGDHTDEKWGWTDLDNASITRFRNDYVLNLPRARVLD